jgi:septal ring factor EnvC (AmiA/AmiB activator)
MNEDQFTKLFKYIEEFRAEVNQRFAETAANIDRLTNTIDSFVKRLDDNETEQTARDYQFEKLLAWARKVSEKTGIPLENL